MFYMEYFSFFKLELEKSRIFDGRTTDFLFLIFAKMGFSITEWVMDLATTLYRVR
ncbi:hypothetical protein P872_15795 [Rhodonellum psychrophilum GCM71 = DSM 17998]|uniref:Uncharacterized protein n=2 Tax=Rhodonellum TaxID=336827 RepID=U5C354_9BACT|nr:hypothetical protein P872_15795 [Rhodonellum psychrophilum GCM71 = DSM 17998]